MSEHRYAYLLRPPSIGCQPDGFTSREGGLPSKIWELENEKVCAFGLVGYPEPLPFDKVWRYDLLPFDRLERAEYRLWVYSGRDQAEVDFYMRDYEHAENLEELANVWDSDPAKLVLEIVNARGDQP